MIELSSRCLYLHRSSDFIGLAGPSLKTLRCSVSPLGDIPLLRAVAKAVPRLTSLTCLTLACCRQGRDLLPLRTLGLRELVLLDTSGLYCSLFSRGGFLALESLQIIETCIDLQPITRETHKWELHRGVGQVMLRLPSLARLSGRSSLFKYVIAENLKGWSDSAVTFRMRSMARVVEIAGHEWVKPIQPGINNS